MTTSSSPLFVPLVTSQKIRSFPKHENGGRVRYLPLDEALTSDFVTDAHFAAYSQPAVERRLCLGALTSPRALGELGGHVAMVLALFDVDCAGAHGGDPTAADSWWMGETAKLRALLDVHPGAFIYRTRGGYRIVYRLPGPLLLRDENDAAAWSLGYLGWVAYLRRRFGIEADPACKEWVRLFRLPRATREEGGRPERRETIGDPANVGAWACEPSEKDLEEAGKNFKKKTRRARPLPAKEEVDAAPPTDGVLQILFRKHGLLGAEVGTKTFAAVCPSEASHSTGERLDGSTVIFPPESGEIFGHLHCRHAHCTSLTLKDVVDRFPAAEVEEAKAAVKKIVEAAEKAAEAERQKARDGGRTSVLVPGGHASEGGVVEVSTDVFAQRVLAALPDDLLYRMDFVVGQIAGSPGERRFVELDDTATRMLVDRHVRLFARKRNRLGQIVEEYIPCYRDLAALIRSAASVSSRVRALRQIVAHPVYLPGFELAKSGWNPSAGVFYDEPPSLEGLVPRPEGAIEALRDLLVDWPFADEASRENAFGMMVTAVLRPAIDGPLPFHLVMASLERTGKGKLIDVALGYAVLGHAIEPIQLGEEEAEREKRITSLVLRGTAAVHFDNISADQVLNSASLASLGTAYPNWSGRILGVSKVPNLPNAGIWVMSGNNVSATGELVKRTVPIVLQPKDDRPHLRADFVHPDCFAYARDRRRATLEALLGIVEQWKSAGRPKCDVVMGGYERWVEAVGGCLRHAGAAHWMTNYTKWVTQADDAQVDTEVLVREWARQFDTKTVTASQLLPIVEQTGAFRWVLSKPSRAGQIVSFGRKVLKALVNRPVLTWIVRMTESGSSASYRLERLAASPATGGPTAAPPQAHPKSSANGAANQEPSSPPLTTTETPPPPEAPRPRSVLL